MNNITLRNRLGCLPATMTDVGGDNIAIALASYFEAHPNRPENDPPDTDTGSWGTWTVQQTNDALDRIVTEMQKPAE